MHRSPAQTGPGVIVEMQVIKKRKKYSAGSGDTASMIKGGGYFGARTRQPPTVQIIKIKINVGQGGCVP